jgi:hypothetical protein
LARSSRTDLERPSPGNIVHPASFLGIILNVKPDRVVSGGPTTLPATIVKQAKRP